MKPATKALMSGRVSLSRSKITAFLIHDRRTMRKEAHRAYILSRFIEVQ
jgi:hypothetical protein